MMVTPRIAVTGASHENQLKISLDSTNRVGPHLDLINVVERVEFPQSPEIKIAAMSES
jgi:hypothetical protein